MLEQQLTQLSQELQTQRTEFQQIKAKIAELWQNFLTQLNLSPPERKCLETYRQSCFLAVENAEVLEELLDQHQANICFLYLKATGGLVNLSHERVRGAQLVGLQAQPYSQPVVKVPRYDDFSRKGINDNILVTFINQVNKFRGRPLIFNHNAQIQFITD